MRKCNASVAAAIFGLGGPPLETLQTLPATTWRHGNLVFPWWPWHSPLPWWWVFPHGWCPILSRAPVRISEEWWKKWSKVSEFLLHLFGGSDEEEEGFLLSFLSPSSHFRIHHSYTVYTCLYNILIFMSNTSAGMLVSNIKSHLSLPNVSIKKSRIAPSPRVSTAMLHTSPSVGTWSLALAVCAVAASGPALRARQRKGHTQRRAENEVPKYLEAPEDQKRVFFWEKTHDIDPPMVRHWYFFQAIGELPRPLDCWMRIKFFHIWEILGVYSWMWVVKLFVKIFMNGQTANLETCREPLKKTSSGIGCIGQLACPASSGGTHRCGDSGSFKGPSPPWKRCGFGPVHGTYGWGGSSYVGPIRSLGPNPPVGLGFMRVNDA